MFSLVFTCVYRIKLFVKVSYLFQSIYYGTQNDTKTKMSFILNQKVSSRFQVDHGRWLVNYQR